MAIKFYMDQHIPRSITSGLRLRGVDVLTTQEDGTEEATDSALLDRATDLARVLFTFDDDLLVEASHRQKLNKHFSGLVYASLQDVSIGKCIRDLEIIAKAGEPAELSDFVVYLPL